MKLLVLVPVSVTTPGITAEQCHNIFARFCREGSFRVVVLKGGGCNPNVEDGAIVARVLTELS